MAANVDIEHDQGATFIKRFRWETSASLSGYVDLTGYTARMQLRTAIDSPDVVIELTTENGRITLGGVNGTIDLLIDADDTSPLDAGTYRYDLELISPTAVVVRLVEGKFKLRPEVTR